MSDCPSRCYEIGGPWITFDPECPVHGYEAQEREQERADLERRVSVLEAQVAELLGRPK